MISWEASLTISRAKIATLQPATQVKVKAWFNACLDAGLRPYIYEGLRTSARQTELFAIGRTKQKSRPVVTNAKAGQSMHQYALAIDFGPLVAVKGKAAEMFEIDWSDKAYKPYHALAVKHGLRRLSWETPHLEDASYANWQAAAKVIKSA
ncbi:MAG: M15 family metallopeptidase [Verrucomicrobiota bacterium]